MKKIILYLTTSTVLLLTCLGYHVNHLFPKDIPFDNSDKARSALAGMTIETTFGMQDSGRTLYLDLKDGEITQRYTRQSTQEKQKDYEISMERIFEMDEQTKKTIGKPKNLSEEGHEIKRVIPQADAAYVFYSSNNIKIPTQYVISNEHYQLQETLYDIKEQTDDTSYITLEQLDTDVNERGVQKYTDVLPTESLIRGKDENVYYFMPQTNTQFHGANHIYKISCESQDKALLQENKVKIKEITPMVTLPAKRSYFIMEKVADRLLVIAYDTKGNTYAMLYDEKGNLQKELKTQQKILFDEFTWQNDGYIHYFADGKLYRLDTNTMKLSNVCPYDTIKLDNVSVDDVYYRDGKTYVLTQDASCIYIQVIEHEQNVYQGKWQLGEYREDEDAYYMFYQARIRR